MPYRRQLGFRARTGRNQEEEIKKGSTESVFCHDVRVAGHWIIQLQVGHVGYRNLQGAIAPISATNWRLQSQVQAEPEPFGGR